MKLTRFEKMLAAILFCGGTMFAYGFAQPPEGERVRVVYEVPGEGSETQEGRYRPSKGRTDEVNLKEELPADEVLTVNVRGTDSKRLDLVEVTLGPSEQSQLEYEIRGLVQKHAKADKEEQKALHAEIESKVGSLFDRRVTAQTNKIAELQAQIKKIQDQLERRKQLRKQIVERRVADLLGEPDELNWDEPIDPVSHLLPKLDFREEALSETTREHLRYDEAVRRDLLRDQQRAYEAYAKKLQEDVIGARRASASKEQEELEKAKQKQFLLEEKAVRAKQPKR